jgi:hypothetical protein
VVVSSLQERVPWLRDLKLTIWSWISVWGNWPQFRVVGVGYHAGNNGIWVNASDGSDRKITGE